jgi:hypothetical protein
MAICVDDKLDVAVVSRAERKPASLRGAIGLPVNVRLTEAMK